MCGDERDEVKEGVSSKQVEEAEQVYRDMLTADVRPSTAVFNNLIAGLSKSGHAHRAFKYFNDVSLSECENVRMKSPDVCSFFSS